MEFSKDSWQWAMMGDFFRLLQKWWIVPEDKKSDDEFWNLMIDDVTDFSTKHSQTHDKIAVHLATLILKHAEDQARGKAVLCEPFSSRAVDAVFGYFLGGGGCLKNGSISQKTDAEQSG